MLLLLVFGYPVFGRQSDQIPFSLGRSFSLLMLSPLQLGSGGDESDYRLLLLLFVMVIVNVYESVCWFGCAHQKLDKLLFYFGFCAWDLFCVFCSMNCFQNFSIQFSLLLLCVCVSSVIFSLFCHLLPSQLFFCSSAVATVCSLRFHSALYSSLHTIRTVLLLLLHSN